VSKKGLPVEAKMRHDSHFVDALAERFGATLGKYLPASAIERNPDQPRHHFGDLSELKASIESKGILEPILVRPLESGNYQIISGERRFRAAIEAGLAEIPCIELDLPDNEALEVALIENLQRKDLTPFEEARAYRDLLERHQYTHARIAETVGRSRVSVTESLALLKIPDDIQEQCRLADIDSKSTLLEIARAASREKMEALVRTAVAGATRSALRTEKKDSSGQDEGGHRARPFQFRYAPKNSPFRLNLAFNRSRVAKDEVLEALRKIIRDIESGELDLRSRK
jgi:ParB family transcriptional regulator, chromosome partitioning protein